MQPASQHERPAGCGFCKPGASIDFRTRLFRDRLIKMIKDLALRQPIGLFRLSLIAIFVGIVTGIGAIAFRGLIGFIHKLFFLGRFSFFYDANSFTPPSPWGVFVILVPVVGALIVTLLVTKFAPEARGHGVPEVMDAIYYAEGRIRPVLRPLLIRSVARHILSCR